MAPLTKKYDFVFLFDVQDGNPNGDPDAGNLPRIDPETGHGIVTDVCLKRKIRNYVTLCRNGQHGYDTYIKEKAVLGRAHFEAFERLGIPLGAEMRREIPEALRAALQDAALPDGIMVEEVDEDRLELVVSADLDKKSAKEGMKEVGLGKEATKFVNEAIASSKTRKPSGEETELGTGEMCRSYFDVRTFGAVMSLKTAPNCGQVRGPVQLTFSRSVDPILPLEHSITRMAVATEKEAAKQSGDNRTMGRKATVPYALYRCHGFVSAAFANKEYSKSATGFSREDLSLLWEALGKMFEEDRSAARGLMSARALYVFEHDSYLGNAPAHRLFDLISIQPAGGGRAPRSFSDYKDRILVDRAGVPPGVKLLENLI